MRETTGRSGRVSTKLKAAVIALLAIFAVSVFGATSANAEQRLKLSFDDSWIKVDALGDSGAFHALDPAAENAQKVDIEGILADDGSFVAKKDDFSFPDQVIDGGEAIGMITLKIAAIEDITGDYDKTSGVFTGQLPLKLTVSLPAAGCKLEPLNIPLSTTGSHDFGTASAANLLSASPFTAASGGAVLGSWTDVGTEDVTGVSPTPDATCQSLIALILASQSADSFDGSIWLKGTSTVSGSNAPTECPSGQTGTPPNCVTPPPEKTPFKVSKVAVSPKKGKVKAGKSIKLKVAVTNSGETAGTATVALKSTNKKVTLPKTLKVSVAAGKTVTKTVTVKASKKAKGKATITAKSGSISGKSSLTVQKAKKKK